MALRQEGKHLPQHPVGGQLQAGTNSLYRKTKPNLPAFMKAVGRDKDNSKSSRRGSKER